MAETSLHILVIFVLTDSFKNCSYSVWSALVKVFRTSSTVN